MSTERPAILLVDDDADLLRLLTLRIEAAGHAVVAANSAERALALISSQRPQLVITDIRMPGMDGNALYEAIRRSFPTLPVIILTAHGTIPDAVAATNRGVFAYLTKPYDARELLDRIASALSITAGGSGEEPADAAWREGILTRNAAMESLLEQARLVAGSDASVMIHGESGTGKEMLAQAIHRASRRARGPFVAVNCGAIPENLLESELFGYVRGAFTGAMRDAPGLIRDADQGTLFLDEIGDMPQLLQVKLLRALEQREVRPLGASRSHSVDIRVVCATHRNLEAEMAAGNFRGDLYYRLKVVSLSIPSLAERREDIPLLAGDFLGRIARRYGKDVNAFAPEAMDLLLRAAWPGNVRQLLNVVEQAVALCTGSVIPAALIQSAIRDMEDVLPFDEARRRFEADYLTRLLRMTGGNVASAAALARRNRTDFYKLLQRHALDPALFK